MNYSPYEMKILLDIHSGANEAPTHSLPLFLETMKDFVARGLVAKSERGYVSGENLPALMAQVLGAPRPRPTESRRKLTERQGEIFAFVKSHTASKGIPPTRVEIADRFGFNSPNAAEDHLRALQRKGYIKLGTARARSIQVIA